VDVSEEHIAYIFMVEEYAKHETSIKVGSFAIGGHFTRLHGAVFQKTEFYDFPGEEKDLFSNNPCLSIRIC
jgi:hypothetical protein